MRLKSGICVTLCLAALLPGMLVSRADAQKRSTKPTVRPATRPRTGQPPAARPVVPQQALPAHYRMLEGNELTQVYGELRRNGWDHAYIAIIPTSYRLDQGHVIPDTLLRAVYAADVDGDRKEDLVVGCYFKPEVDVDREPAFPGMMLSTIPPEDDRSRILVFSRDAQGHWRIKWRSPGLGDLFAIPKFNAVEVRERLDSLANLMLPLSLRDIDGDGRFEIAYSCSSASPKVEGQSGIYRFDANRWVNIAPQGHRFSLRDLNNDGKIEVVTASRYIGYGKGDDDVPRVWRWAGRQYRESSAEFPGYYRDLAERYTSYLRQKMQRGEGVDRAVWERAIQKAASLAT